MKRQRIITISNVDCIKHKDKVTHNAYNVSQSTHTFAQAMKRRLGLHIGLQLYRWSLDLTLRSSPERKQLALGGDRR